MGIESSNVVANESGEELPDLRFHDTTPITKSNNKRGCAEMSPIQEQQINGLMGNEVWNTKIEEMIIKSVNNAVPKIIECHHPNSIHHEWHCEASRRRNEGGNNRAGQPGHSKFRVADYTESQVRS